MSEATTISVSGPLGLAQMEELRQRLLDAFAESHAVVLDIGDDAQPDLSFIQLLEVARRHARSSAKDFLLLQPVSNLFAALIERAGLLTKATPEDLFFWFHWKEKP